MIFITGDIHGQEFSKLNMKNFPEQVNLTKADYVIVTGDFGLTWPISFDNTKVKRTDPESYWINWLNKKPWTTLFVDGNHENHRYLSSLSDVEMFGSVVGKVSDSIFHLRRGQIYNIDGKKILTFGGALSIDRKHRVLNESYWEEEVATKDDYNRAVSNLDKYDWSVDYVVSHAASLSTMYLLNYHPIAVGEYLKDPTSVYLNKILSELSYKKHYCGHLHEDRTIDKTTVLYDSVLKIE